MEFRTAIIVPCYNEAKRLKLEAFKSFVLQHKSISLWFANDGSQDETLEIIEALAKSVPDQIYVFHSAVNCGKAEILRKTFLQLHEQSTYTHVGFIDADLSCPLPEILPLVQQFKTTDRLILAAGVRIKILGNHIERQAMRHYISRIFATFYNMLLLIPNYDTQCGLKLFDSSHIPDVFGRPFISKWLFDIELFLRIQGIVGRQAYEERIREIPVGEWKEVAGSKLKITDFLMAPLEVLKIRKKYSNIIKS